MARSRIENIITPLFHSVYLRLKGLTGELEARHVKKQLMAAGLAGVDSIPTHTEKPELAALYHLAAACPPNSFALETGSYLGASTCYLAAGLLKNNGHLYCVDTWNNETMPEGIRDTFREFSENVSAVGSLITPLRMKSCELSARDVSIPLSLIFIDGDHGYEAVKSDFTLVKDWLSDNGSIAFHDFGAVDYEGVTRVLGEALASGEWVISGMEGCLVWIRRAYWSRQAGNRNEV